MVHLSRLRTLVIAVGVITVGVPIHSVRAQQPGSGPLLGSVPPADGDDLPLSPGRSLHIDNTEGTWISLDVSPDGQRVVFDYLGNLFTVPIQGGNATQLTAGMAFDAQPRFSPDGEQIVFTSDRDGGENIWLLSLTDHQTSQITHGKTHRAESPEWTPDGNYVIASMADGHGPRDLPRLRIYNVRGGTGAEFVHTSDLLKMMGAAFGSDPRYIWFARLNTAWEYNADLPQYQLNVYDRDTGEMDARTSRHGSGFRPTLSPDGHWLVYGSRLDARTGLVLRDLHTDEERWLAYPTQHDDQESRATLGVLPGMSFTPDSKYLVTSYGGKIWKLPVAGGPAEQIPFRVQFDLSIGPKLDFNLPIEDTPTFIVRQIRDAVPSPDGSRIAFTSLDQLWIADSDGSNPRRLTQGSQTEYAPAWSPDGQWIAYGVWDGEAGDIWKIRADGRGSARRLTEHGAFYTMPAWSPDGERIVAMRGRARAFQRATGFATRSVADEVVWVPAEGGKATLIAAGDRLSHPHFNSDHPGRIYLYSRSKGLVSMRWDGTDQQGVVNVNGDLILMAPSGHQALATVHKQIFVVTVPRIGGETPTISVSNPSSAAFPTRRLTDPIGGEFPAWSADGRKVHWSLGNAHFVYDLDAAQASDHAAAATRRAAVSPAEVETTGGASADSTSRADGTYHPREFRITVHARRDIPEGVVVLRGGRAITMRGDEVIENADIVIRNNRIVAVGTRGAVDVPADAHVVDVSGKTIIPGLIDVHSHPSPPWGVHRRDHAAYAAYLAYGVTTIRNPQTTTTDVLTYADLIRAGEIFGPRIYSTGPGIRSYMEINSLADAHALLRRYSDYYDTGWLKMYDSGTRERRQWIVMAARDLGLMVTTEGALDAKQNLTTTIDGYPGMEHAIPIYPDYSDLIELFARSGRTYTPTLMVAYGGPAGENYFFESENVHDDPKLRHFTPHDILDAKTRRRKEWFLPEEQVFPHLARFAADIVNAGGRVAVGGHSRLPGLDTHWEMWALQMGGMSAHDVLRAGTLSGAEAIGIDEDLGSIEPGKLADLVVLERNPLADIRNTNTVLYVMKNGRLYDGDTLKELYPRKRGGPHFWWWDEQPGNIPGMSIH